MTSGNWIPISERLPEPQQEVLLAIKSYNDEFWCYEVGTVGKEEGLYYYAGDYDYLDRVGFWQPLPEGPVATPRGGE